MHQIVCMVFFAISMAFLPIYVFAWPATIISVHDGDTLKVAPLGDISTPITIRLYGIDAPELAQESGNASRDYLRELLPENCNAEIIPMSTDKYGRIVGLVGKENKIINAKMIEMGQAWVYPRYCKAKFCKNWRNLENGAKTNSKGLWGIGEPVAPWEFRKFNQEKVK